jgi:hypothetical protein
MHRTFCLSLLLFLAASFATAADWLTAPSYYSHDPRTGERVTQYAQTGPVYRYDRPDYLQSGYRQSTFNLQMGRSVDHMHIVEEWGRPVRPYGEWQYPYRPYSVPYQGWGPPFGGLNVYNGYGPYYGGAPGAGPAPIPPAGFPPGGYGGIPGGGGALNTIPPASLTDPRYPDNGGSYPAPNPYPHNRGGWDLPASGVGGT